jgi:hypothetical protein
MVGEPSHVKQLSLIHVCKIGLTFVIAFLKVPKCEIFNRSDFPDFYTIKSLRVGDFGVKIKKNFKNIQGFI